MKNTIKCMRKFRGVHMKISSISSGSKGNCIVVDNENTTLMVDVGISRKKTEEGLEFFNKTDSSGRWSSTPTWRA